MTISRTKKYLYFLLSSLVFLALVGGKSVRAEENKPQVNTTLANLSDEELLRVLENNTDVKKLTAKGIYVTFIEKPYGNNYGIAVLGPNYYQTQFESNGYMMIDTPLVSYGYKLKNKGVKLVLVADTRLRQYMYDHSTSALIFMEADGATILSRSEKDGILTLKVEVEGYESMVGSYANEFDAANHLMDNLVGGYEIAKIDIATCSLLSEEVYGVYKDGSEVLVSENTYEYSKTAPDQDDLVKPFYDSFFTGDTNTITIVVGKGTERERTYSVAARPDCFLDYWIKDVDNTYAIYDDPEYTIPATVDRAGFIQFDQNKVLYMK